MTTGQKGKGLILFLIFADLYKYDTAKGDPKTIRELDALYRDFRYSTLDENYPIYIIHNSIRYKDNKQEDKTFVHKVIKGRNGSQNEITDIAIINTPYAVQKQDHLKTIFQMIDDIEKPTYIFLTTWDHGSVFGIFKETRHPDFGNYVSLQSGNKVFGINEFLKGNFVLDQVLTDDPPPPIDIELNIEVEILTNEELAFAIQSGFTKKRVDTLTMMNCNLMNVHSIGALKNVVDHFIAPATDIDEPGYNYCAIINKTSSVFPPKPRVVAEYCVESLATKSECSSPVCLAYRNNCANESKKWKVFATDMQPAIIDDLILLINTFSKRILSKFPNNTAPIAQSFCNCVSQARNSIQLLTDRQFDYHLYDLSNWSLIVYDHCRINFKPLFEIIKEDLEFLRSSMQLLKGNFIIAESNKTLIPLSPFCVFFPIKKVLSKTNGAPYINTNAKEDDILFDWLNLLQFFFS